MITKQLLSTSGGELSPRLSFRNDFGRYDSGCRTLENFICTAHGAAIKRPGTDVIYDIPAGDPASDTGRLVPMQISTDHHIVLVLSDGVAHVTANGAVVEDTGTPVAFHIPWSDAELPALKWRQINNVIYFTHPEHAPRRLVRVSDTDWDFAVVPFGAAAPVLTENADPDWTLDVSFALASGASAWSGSSVAYAIGEKVTYSGKTYQANGAHTSTAGNHPLSGSLYAKPIYDSNGRYLGAQNIALWSEVYVDRSCVPGAAVTLTASRDTFDASHVGSVWRIGGEAESTAYEASIAAINALGSTKSVAVPVLGEWTFTTFGTWDGSYAIERSEDGGLTWKELIRFTSTTAVPRNVSFGGTEDTRVLLRLAWYYVGNGMSNPYGLLEAKTRRLWGYVKITALDGTTPAKIATGVAVSALEYGKTSHWCEGAFSDYQGYPNAVELHQSRIVYGGTARKPHTVWASAVDDYNNFAPGTAADDSWRHTLVSGERDPILWMLSDKYLMIGTGSAEFAMFGGGENQPITAEGRVVRKLSSIGSDARGIGAIPSESVPLFIQRGGDRILELTYVYDSDRFDSSNICLLAEHVHRGKVIRDMALQRSPHQILWTVDDDGLLAGHTYERRQQVAGWHRHTSVGAEYRSVCVCLGDDSEDHVYLLAYRHGRLTLERFGRGCVINPAIGSTWTDATVSVSEADYSAADRFWGLYYGEVAASYGGRWWIGSWTSGMWALFTGYLIESSESWGGKYFQAGTYDGAFKFLKSGHETLGDLADFIVLQDGRWVIWSEGAPVAWIGTDDNTPPDDTTITAYEGGTTSIGTARHMVGSPAALGRDLLWSAVAGTWYAWKLDLAGKVVYKHLTLARTLQFESHSGTDKWTQKSAAGVVLFHAASGSADVTAVTWINTLTGQAAAGTFSKIGTDNGDTVKVGIPVTSTYKPMPLALQTQNGTSRSREQRIHAVVPDLEGSYGGWFGPDAANLLPIHSDIAAHDGEKELSFVGGHGILGDLVIVADAPAPFILRGLTVKFNVFGDGN